MGEQARQRKPIKAALNAALRRFRRPREKGQRRVLALLKRFLGGKALPEALSYEKARAALESHEKKLEEELAGRTDAEPEMLYYLAERGTAKARKAVAANPSTPPQANVLLSGDIEPDIRAELARKIGRLLPDLLASEREQVCQLTLQTLSRLAADQLPRVRAILAEEIKRFDCVPREIVAALARDLEEDVCVPILAYSPLLSDEDLTEIVASARVQGALAAVAQRANLSEKVSAALVATLDVPAVATLLANPSAKIREETMAQIVERAESVASWHGVLVMRSDLSLRALRRIAGFVGTALLRHLAERHDLDSDTRTHLARALRTRLEKEHFEAHDEEEKAQHEAHKAHQSGMLDEKFVEAAAEAGKRDLVLESLALLAGVPRAVVDKIVAARSAKAATALTWRAGLPMRIAFKIQTLVVKLKASELLPARAGVSYPLSEDEMGLHLSMFGVSEKKRS